MVMVIIISILMVALIIAFVCKYVFHYGECNHEWRIVHNTKYDNIGFRKKYDFILVCEKCGKIKKVR